MEVLKGILKAQNAVSQGIAFIRTINNINTNTLHQASKFIDITNEKVDEDAQILLSELRDIKVIESLASSNIKHFYIDWIEKEGLTRKTHEEYLNNFGNSFYDLVISFIDKEMKQKGNTAKSRLYNEVLQHLHTCKKLIQIFKGREKELDMINKYIINNRKYPLILYGPEGSGKTNFLAKCASLAKEWTNNDIVLILRFLGTSPDSSSLTSLLISIINQIIYNYNLPKEEIPTDINKLISYFKKIIYNINKEKLLIILLDSLNFLYCDTSIPDLSWIPINLPDNVKVILSVSETFTDILDNLNNYLENSEKNYVQIQSFESEIASKIILKMLHNANRKITEKQWEIVRTTINKCSLGIFIKLVFSEINQWKSYSTNADATLKYTVRAAVLKLFNRIEHQHGKILVSHCLTYITLSKNGLSESELEDLLSLDDRVLEDVYQYHLPPIRRIPPLLWSRIRNDLPNYLVETEADKTPVLKWYHQQFVDVIKECYCKNINSLKMFHSNISDYFLGLWSLGKAKPFSYTELQRKRFGIVDIVGEADRKVPSQPLAYFAKDGTVKHYNLRKLNELPFHLIRSERINDFYQIILFNYEWIHSKLSCYSLHYLLNDIEDFLSYFESNLSADIIKQVILLVDSLKLSSGILNKSPDMLGIHLVGRLMPLFGMYEKLDSLLSQCDTIGIKHCSLIAMYNFLHTPGGPLQFSLEDHYFAVFGMILASDNRHLYSISNCIIVHDLLTGETIRRVFPEIEGLLQKMILSLNDHYLITYTNLDIIIILNNLTGDLKKFKGPNNIKDLTICETTFILWTEKSYHKFTFAGQKINSYTQEDQYIILQIHSLSEEDYDIILWDGVCDEGEFLIETFRKGHQYEVLNFHYALVGSKKGFKIYTCILKNDKYTICMCELEAYQWKMSKYIDRELFNKRIINLKLSPDEKYLLASLFKGFKIWDLEKEKQYLLKLPKNINNIPILPMHSTPVIFSTGNQYIIASVRSYLYVWKLLTCSLIKVFDVHYSRILCLIPVNTDKKNMIVSSSLDKSIKVWNLNNIREEAFTIDKDENVIENIYITDKIEKVFTKTRTHIGIWNIYTGKLLSTLSAFKYGSIITHMAINHTAEYIVTSENENLIIWDVENESIISQREYLFIEQLLFTENDCKIIIVSKKHNSYKNTTAICILKNIPTGESIYTIKFSYKLFRKVIVNCDGNILLISQFSIKKMKEYIGLYNANTGVYIKRVSLQDDLINKFVRFIPIPNRPHEFGLLEQDGGHIYNLKQGKIITTIKQWNGLISTNGKIGIKVSDWGLLELINIKNGSTKLTLMKNLNESLIFFTVIFSQTCEHLLYYQKNLRVVKVFRVSDGKLIATYTSHVEISLLDSTKDGKNIVIGGNDGSLTTLAIVDVQTNENGQNIIQNLRKLQNCGSSHFNKKKTLNTKYRSVFQTVLAVAKIKRIRKERLNQSSMLCNIS